VLKTQHTREHRPTFPGTTFQERLLQLPALSVVIYTFNIDEPNSSMIVQRQQHSKGRQHPCRTAGLQWHPADIRQRSFFVVSVLLIAASAARGVGAHSTQNSFESTMISSRNPHQQMCSLLFQTPACTQPAIWRKPVVARPSPSSCSLDTCSLSGPSSVQAKPALAVAGKAPSRRKVAASAQLASSTTSTSTDQWWKKQSELWVDVHTEEQFYHEINSGDRLVFVGESHAYLQPDRRPGAQLAAYAACPAVPPSRSAPCDSITHCITADTNLHSCPQTSSPHGAAAANARIPSCARSPWTLICRRRSSLSRSVSCTAGRAIDRHLLGTPSAYTAQHVAEVWFTQA
jgi:hypothetical protein